MGTLWFAIIFQAAVIVHLTYVVFSPLESFAHQPLSIVLQSHAQHFPRTAFNSASSFPSSSFSPSTASNTSTKVNQEQRRNSITREVLKLWEQDG